MSNTFKSCSNIAHLKIDSNQFHLQDEEFCVCVCNFYLLHCQYYNTQRNRNIIECICCFNLRLITKRVSRTMVHIY